jgi:hypothetical protein
MSSTLATHEQHILSQPYHIYSSGKGDISNTLATH